MRPCTWCGEDVGKHGYQQITAFVVMGKRDSVSLREDVSPPRFACRRCVLLRQHGIPVGQGSLT